MKEYTFDATDQKIGRLATQIAVALMGKNEADFARNKVANVKVVVNNASKMAISEKKKKTKTYDRYSGYPGGRKVISLEKLIADKGYGMALRNAVFGMLPKNKLRSQMIKNLIINE